MMNSTILKMSLSYLENWATDSKFNINHELLMIRDICNIFYLQNKEILSEENSIKEICQSLTKPLIYKLFQNYKPDE
jgi:ABC-type dipeptide/oligopeptide/nickel transport system ATPase subunit